MSTDEIGADAADRLRRLLKPPKPSPSGEGYGGDSRAAAAETARVRPTRALSGTVGRGTSAFNWTVSDAPHESADDLGQIRWDRSDGPALQRRPRTLLPNPGWNSAQDRDNGRLARPVGVRPRWVRSPTRTFLLTSHKHPNRPNTGRILCSWESSPFTARRRSTLFAYRSSTSVLQPIRFGYSIRVLYRTIGLIGVFRYRNPLRSVVVQPVESHIN